MLIISIQLTLLITQMKKKQTGDTNETFHYDWYIRRISRLSARR